MRRSGRSGEDKGGYYLGLEHLGAGTLSLGLCVLNNWQIGTYYMRSSSG